jgi:hypothetical protein
MGETLGKKTLTQYKKIPLYCYVYYRGHELLLLSSALAEWQESHMGTLW